MIKMTIFIASIFLSITAFVLTDKHSTDNNQCQKIETVKAVNLEEDKTSSTTRNFYYGIDSRFLHQVTKKQLHEANSIEDIYPKNTVQESQKFNEIKLTIMPDPEIVISEKVNSKLLSAAQKELLQQCDYSTNLYLTSYYSTFDVATANTINNHIVYYMTVIPEVEAKYKGGKQEMLRHLREKMEEQTSLIDMSKIKPGRIKFTVDKNGIIRNVNLDSTLGFGEIDEAFMTHIAMMPGEWTPAKNAKGENVDQKLIFFYGSFGC